jgi:putative ABC transport system ATP-binding protein
MDSSIAQTQHRDGASVAIAELSKNYRTAAAEVVALDNVSVQFPAAEAAVLMGPSGCGKTSLLNLIAGIDRATSGSIVVGGADVTRLGERELERYRLLQVGYVFQFFNLIPSLTALENLELPMLIAGAAPQARRSRTQALLETVGLKDKGHKRPEQLSGGEQQRVAIARALSNEPKIILADEPTGNLDSSTGRTVIDLLLAINRTRGTTVIVVTHDPDIASMADARISLRDGRIVA